MREVTDLISYWNLLGRKVVVRHKLKNVGLNEARFDNTVIESASEYEKWYRTETEIGPKLDHNWIYSVPGASEGRPREDDEHQVANKKYQIFS